MKIGLIDVDSHNYPNLPLMKIAASDSAEAYAPYQAGAILLLCVEGDRWCRTIHRYWSSVGRIRKSKK